MSRTNSLTDCATRLRGWIDALNRSRSSELGSAPPPATMHHEPDPHAATFDRLARDLFAAQFEGNAAYRRFCEARGTVPATVTDWRQIPAVPAAAFKDLELTSIPASARTALFHSSGTTTQRPSRHFHHATSLALYEASLRPWFATHVLGAAAIPLTSGSTPAGDPAPGHERSRILALTPRRKDAPHSSLVHMFETVVQAFATSESVWAGGVARDGSWTLDLAEAQSALRRAMKEKHPIIVLGTAFSFVHFLDYLAECQSTITLPPGSRVMETGGYKGRSRSLLKSELHGLLTRQLGVSPSHIVCEYGMSELSSQAYDHIIDDLTPTNRAPTRVFRFPPWARAQILSPETGREVADGQTGLIRVLDLANVYSVMNVQTEDLGVRRGNGFELIGRDVVAEPRGCSLMAIP